MLPALVLFRPKGRDLQGRGAFLITGFLIPSDWNVIASLAFFMPIRGVFPTIHTNLWNPVASYCHCVLSPHLRIAPVPGLGPGGIGIGGLCRALPHVPCNTLYPRFRLRSTSPAPEAALEIW